MDLRSMCAAYVRDFFGPGFGLERACYFSALAHHLKPWKPRVVERHETYIRALESVGVRREESPGGSNRGQQISVVTEIGGRHQTQKGRATEVFVRTNGRQGSSCPAVPAVLLSKSRYKLGLLFGYDHQPY
ncbi:MAG: hypothetical protein ACREM1_21160 [Longimicrobiales bacterium]